MSHSPSSILIREYHQNADLYRTYLRAVNDLVVRLLKAEKLKFHKIEPRLKAEGSVRTKVDKSPGKYSSIEKMTDVCGIRIIVYFEDDVARVVNIIEREFEVDLNNSVDKKELFDPDRFGYLSQHLVVRISQARLKFTEYSAFAGLKCEIQIRSGLQHVWSEIDHGLDYKSEITVPRLVRRRLSRLAAMLELTDEEFIRVRDLLEEYKASLPERINKKPEKVPVDGASIRALLSSEIVQDLDRALAVALGSSLGNKASANRIAKIVEALIEVEIENIGTVIERLQAWGSKMPQMLREWSPQNRIWKGMAVWLVPILTVSNRGSEDDLLKFSDKFQLRLTTSSARRLVSMVRDHVPASD